MVTTHYLGTHAYLVKKYVVSNNEQLNIVFCNFFHNYRCGIYFFRCGKEKKNRKFSYADQQIRSRIRILLFLIRKRKKRICNFVLRI
jgi:hypothetical protein